VTSKINTDVPGGLSPWDLYYKDTDMVKGRQKLLDANKDNKITKEDFTMLRNRPKTENIKRKINMEKKNAR
jgi:hypothetical protein